MECLSAVYFGKWCKCELCFSDCNIHLFMCISHASYVFKNEIRILFKYFIAGISLGLYECKVHKRESWSCHLGHRLSRITREYILHISWWIYFLFGALVQLYVSCNLHSSLNMRNLQQYLYNIPQYNVRKTVRTMQSFYFIHSSLSHHS